MIGQHGKNFGPFTEAGAWEAGSEQVSKIKNYSTGSKKCVDNCFLSIKVQLKSRWAHAQPAQPIQTTLRSNFKLCLFVNYVANSSKAF